MPIEKIKRKLIKFKGDTAIVEEKLKGLCQLTPEEVITKFGIERAQFDAICLDYPTIRVNQVARILAKNGGDLETTRDKLKRKSLKKSATSSIPH